MEPRVLITLFAVIAAFCAGLFALYTVWSSKRQSNLRNLMQSGRSQDPGGIAEVRTRLKNDETGFEFERLKEETRGNLKKKKQLTLEEKFYHSGLFSPDEQSNFKRAQIIIPLVLVPVFAYGGSFAGGTFVLVGAIMGFLVGLQGPVSYLDRKIKQRDDEIMFYLPLVIEQISIGVSSSLDVGPCIAKVVSMADERDSHNVVTELLRQMQYQVRSGASLEQALTEIGIKAGHTELKHSFMALSQVAKHGGEITRQLQELADAVSSQRETRIEGKIKKLELEATGPVAMVFFGFMIILLIGFGIQIQAAFA